MWGFVLFLFGFVWLFGFCLGLVGFFFCCFLMNKHFLINEVIELLSGRADHVNYCRIVWKYVKRKDIAFLLLDNINVMVDLSGL